MSKSLRGIIALGLSIAVLGGLWAAMPPSTQAQTTVWSVQIYDNTTLSGTPYATGVATSSVLNYNWGGGTPSIDGVTFPASPPPPTDNFSIRFTTSAAFTAGTYKFTVVVDDGARLYLDGGLSLIDVFTEGGPRTLEASYTLATDGYHAITVEMLEVTGGASISLSWALVSGGGPVFTSLPGGNPWSADFYNGTDLTGSPIYSTAYPPSGLNLNWGQGSPGGAVPVDNFSARFTRTFNVPGDIPTGIYRFYIKADDAFRFIVDTTTIIDHWGGFEDQVFTADVTLVNGPHTLKLEYREFSSNALVFLTWTPPSGQNPVLNPDGSSGAATPGVTPGATVVTPGVPAQTGVTATVNVNVLNVRDYPSKSGKIMATVSKPSTYLVTGKTADEVWVQIIVNSQVGWVMTQYVTISGDMNRVPVLNPTPGSGMLAATPVPTAEPVAVRGKVIGNLRIRSGPSTRTERLGFIPWNTVVDILGRDANHDWYQVSYNGIVGWSYAPWIVIVEGDANLLPATDGSVPVFAAPPTQGVIIQAYGNMRIRSGPGLQYPKISKAVWGTRLEAIGVSTDGRWYKIRYGDVLGWTYAIWYRVVQGDVKTLPAINQ